MPADHVLHRDLEAFAAQKDELEKHYRGKFAVFHNGEFVDAFDTFDRAAREATKAFGRDPFLIRLVGDSPTMAMPASIAFRPVSAAR